MSQRDVLGELQAARVTAPPELRERIRLVAASDTTPPRRVTWRRALVVAVPVAAAIAATVVFTRPASHPQSKPLTFRAAGAATEAQPSLKVAPTPSRVQTYATTLALELPTPAKVSDAIKRALAITASLSGYPSAVHAQTHGDKATATLTLKVPRANVQRAVARLSQLGTITAEQVAVTDKQDGLNTIDREIARLQRQLAAAPPHSKRAAALTAQIQRLQRAEAQTRRTAHYATIHLSLRTPQAAAPAKPSRLHGVGVALTWLGIGAVYALAIGLPVALVLALVWLAVRTVRRRREDALLNDR
jgi:hypothetical protein